VYLIAVDTAKKIASRNKKKAILNDGLIEPHPIALREEN